MRNVLIWIKRHFLWLGSALILVAAIIFFAVYRVTQVRPPGEIIVNDSGISITQYTAYNLGIWIFAAIALGAGGIFIAGYSFLKKQDARDKLSEIIDRGPKHGKR